MTTQTITTDTLCVSALLEKMNEMQQNMLVMAQTIMQLQQGNTKKTKVKKTDDKPVSNFTTHEFPKPKAQAADSIKSLEEIQMVFEYFLSRHQYRNYALFVTGISSAYRISDLVKMKFSDFYKEDGTFKFEFDMKEKKTGKRRKIEITKPIRDAITLYIEKSGIIFEYDSPMFRSEKCKNTAITKETFHKILKDSIQRDLKLQYNIGTHTMRKTYGYTYLQAHKNDMTALATLQKIFGHSSERETLKYCGVSLEEMRQTNRNVSNLWEGLIENIHID